MATIKPLLVRTLPAHCKSCDWHGILALPDIATDDLLKCPTCGEPVFTGEKYLFEITNGFVGVAYVRVYAWAKDEEEALSMARKSFTNDPQSQGNPRYVNNLNAKKLFSSSDESFCTRPCSEGFEP